MKEVIVAITWHYPGLLSCILHLVCDTAIINISVYIHVHCTYIWPAGICGSCSMNIGGQNTLACIRYVCMCMYFVYGDWVCGESKKNHHPQFSRLRIWCPASVYKCSFNMLKNVWIEVPKSIETKKHLSSKTGDDNNYMCNPHKIMKIEVCTSVRFSVPSDILKTGWPESILTPLVYQYSF